jgi:hypothetical protein
MRRLLRQSLETDLPGQLAVEKAEIVNVAAIADAAQGIAAFAAHRPPRFTGVPRSCSKCFGCGSSEVSGPVRR